MPSGRPFLLFLAFLINFLSCFSLLLRPSVIQGTRFGPASSLTFISIIGHVLSSAALMVLENDSHFLLQSASSRTGDQSVDWSWSMNDRSLPGVIFLVLMIVEP